MATTLRDIATRVGTSEATVSLVLNGHQYHRVSQAMRERIELVARELEYKPNRQAQLLAGGKTKAIALLVSRFDDLVQARYLAEIESRLCEQGYQAIPCSTGWCCERIERLFEMPSQRLCDGIVVLGGAPARDVNNSVAPLVRRHETYHAPAEPIRVDGVISVNYNEAALKLFQHLKNEGVTRVGVITQQHHDLGLPPAQQSPRAIAHAELLNQFGLHDDSLPCIALPHQATLSDWAAATERIMREAPGLDGLLIGSGWASPAVLHQLASSGRRPGQDIAVAACDDTPNACWLGEGLATIREPIAAVAESLVSAILDRVMGKAERAGAAHKAELMIRSSSSLA